MNLTRKMTGILTMATLVALLGSVAQAEDGVRQINSANQTLLDGRVDEALAQYQLAEQSVPASPLLAYNKGVAFYQQGNIEQARQSFTHALDTDDPELASQASFNLGNCHYATAVSQAETESGLAIESLRTAIAHYRSALQTNPWDTDSRTNIELASQLMQKLQQQEEQQQQQEQQQCENQDCQNQDASQSEQSESSDSDSEKSDEQSSDDSKSDQNQADEPQDSSEQDDAQQQSDESESDESQSEESQSEESQSEESKSEESQSEESNSNEAESDQSDAGKQSDEEQPSDSNSASNSEEANEESADQQNPSAAQNQGEEQSPEQQAGEQPLPGQPLPEQEQPEQEQSREQMSGRSVGQQDQRPAGEQTPGYAFSQAGEPSENIDEEEAMKMLQAIRDRDLMRRMKKLNEKRRRHRPVDRDW